MSVAVAVVLAFCGAAVSFLVTFRHDPPELLDLDEVTTAAVTGCQGIMAARPPIGADRVATIRVENLAIADLVSRMHAIPADVLDDDYPARAWTADWEDLAQARAAFAADLGAGRSAEFRIPMTDDGLPITGRMILAEEEGCERAVRRMAAP